MLRHRDRRGAEEHGLLRVTASATPVSPMGDTGPGIARMRAIVERLAAADLTGRRVGTAGGREAAAWLARCLRDAGAQVRPDPFEVAGAVREVHATPVARFGGARLTFRRDFCEHLASAELPEPVSAPLSAVAAPGAWFAGSWGPDAVAAAVSAGAVGLLVPRGTDEAGWMPKMIAGPAVVDVPVLAVRGDLHARMREEGGELTASVPVRTVDVAGSNVVAEFRPPGALSILLTAHFDGVGDDPGTRFPAACDNASGVAGVIEAARMLHATLPPGVGLSVALLDAEEAGAHGSAHHAPQVPPGTYVINLDGAARLGVAAVEAGGAARPLLTALDRAARRLGVPLRAEAMPSDNRRYAAAGLPAAGIGMGMPGYQTPAETPDRVEDTTLAAAASLLAETVTELALPPGTAAV